jgi:hypothetical protein
VGKSDTGIVSMLLIENIENILITWHSARGSTYSWVLPQVLGIPGSGSGKVQDFGLYARMRPIKLHVVWDCR